MNSAISYSYFYELVDLFCCQYLLKVSNGARGIQRRRRQHMGNTAPSTFLFFLGTCSGTWHKLHSAMREVGGGTLIGSLIIIIIIVAVLIRLKVDYSISSFKIRKMDSRLIRRILRGRDIVWPRGARSFVIVRFRIQFGIRARQSLLPAFS